MVAGVVEIPQEELDELLRYKDEAHSLRQERQSAALCDHACEHGHKVILVDPAEKKRIQKEIAEQDYADKKLRLENEDKRLDSLVRQGIIDRRDKEKIMRQERERLGFE